MGAVVLHGLVLPRCIPFAVIALHFFGRSIVAVTIEVDRHKGDSRSG
jgi:hypothetical protein